MRQLFLFIFLISSTVILAQTSIQSELYFISENSEDINQLSLKNISKITSVKQSTSRTKKKPITKVFEFKSEDVIIIKHYYNNRLTSTEECQLDAQKRTSFSTRLYYHDLLGWVRKYNRFSYTDSSKEIEELTNEDVLLSKTKVDYNTEKLPIKITKYNANNQIDGWSTADYDSDFGTYVYKSFDEDGNIISEEERYFNQNFIIKKNSNGDVVKKYWPLAPKENTAIHTYEYEYDRNGNWVYQRKELITSKKTKVLSIISRTIEYNDDF